MTTRASFASVAPWIGVAVVLLFALHDRLELVDNRVLILIGLAVAAVGIAHRGRDALSAEGRSPEARTLRRRTVIAGVLLVTASVGLAVLRSIIDPKLGLRSDLISALVPPLLGWSIFLVLPIGLSPAPEANAWEPDVRPGPAILAATAFVGIWLATLARTHFDIIDEVLYAWQAHRFALGHATLALDPALQRFVKLPLMGVTPEGIYTQYTPGYPAILALFVRLGIPSLCGATLGALAVLGTHRLGRRVGSAPVGFIAALLLATNAFVVRWSAAYMSHAAAMTALCVAAWLAIDAAGRVDRRADVESVLAGFLIGVAVTVRPVTGLAIGLSIWLVLLARRAAWSRLSRVTVMLCVGGALPLVAMLAYNAATTGNPFQLGYQATLGHLNDPGFGTRGIILYDRDVRPVVSSFQFTFRDALRNEITVAAWPLARDLFPVWWLLPLVAVAMAYRMRVRWAVVGAFCLLPVVNFTFFGNTERFYVELIPFALVGVALLVRHVGTIDSRAARAVMTFLVGAGIVASATRIAADRWQATRRPPASERLARALRDSSRASPRLLVFVRNPPLAEPLLIGLSQFNFGRFPGGVVVARDLGAENARLACRLRGYRVLVAESATAARDAHLASQPDSSLADRCVRPDSVVSLPRPSA